MPTVRHADDFASWLDCLRSDTLAIIRAAPGRIASPMTRSAGQWGRVKPPGHSETQASKAADWLMGCLPEDVAIPETTPDDEEAA